MCALRTVAANDEWACLLNEMVLFADSADLQQAAVMETTGFAT